MTSSELPAVYGKRAIWLHWLTAALILLQWYMGRNIDWFPPPIARMYARSTHMLIGLVVLALVTERIWRRLSQPVAHAPGGPRWANLAAIAVHWGLYALVVAVIAVGLATVWVRGDLIFGLFKVPAFDPHHREYRRLVGDFHGLLANLLLALAAFHAAAAIVHHWMWKDGVLGRMIPALRKA